jgi:hypothetical protein
MSGKGPSQPGIETMNLTLDDCIGICGLTREEIQYFVEHEDITDFRAAELAERYVVLDDTGTPHLRREVLADIEALERRNEVRDARALESFIRDFVLSHPHIRHVRAAGAG